MKARARRPIGSRAGATSDRRDERSGDDGGWIAREGARGARTGDRGGCDGRLGERWEVWIGRGRCAHRGGDVGGEFVGVRGGAEGRGGMGRGRRRRRRRRRRADERIFRRERAWVLSSRDDERWSCERWRDDARDAEFLSRGVSEFARVVAVFLRIVADGYSAGDAPEGTFTGEGDRVSGIVVVASGEASHRFAE